METRKKGARQGKEIASASETEHRNEADVSISPLINADRATIEISLWIFRREFVVPSGAVYNLCSNVRTVTVVAAKMSYSCAYLEQKEIILCVSIVNPPKYHRLTKLMGSDHG